MKSFIIIAFMLHAAFAAPQLITFKDGKVGVNFFGYHAEAGLGGGQNSESGLLGGLHASAGTPWGQNAAAGLGGNVNGRAAGVLYAGAQATPDVGASAVLGGDTSQGGYGASEAYIPGKTARRTHTSRRTHVQHHDIAVTEYPTEGPNVIQKVRPPKKYRGDQAHIAKSVEKRQLIASGTYDAPEPQSANQVSSGSIVHRALQIPVGILQSLQASLGGLP